MFFFRENRLPLFFTLILLAFIVAKAYNYVQDHNKAQASVPAATFSSQEQVAQEIAEPPVSSTETQRNIPPKKPLPDSAQANPKSPDSPDVEIPPYEDPALEPTEVVPMPDTVTPSARGESKP